MEIQINIKIFLYKKMGI